MADFDILEFIYEQRGKGRDALLLALQQETIRVDYKLAGKKRAQARAAGGEAYRALLMAAASWLRTGRRPPLPSEAAPIVRLCERVTGAHEGALAGRDQDAA